MRTSKQRTQFNPIWWSAQHTVLWEEYLPKLRGEFQRHANAERHEQVASVGPDDSIFQKHPATPRNVSIESAHGVPDEDWELGTVWEQIEPALRLGVGARIQYFRYEIWNDELEALLREEWDATNAPGTWKRMRRVVRRGFEAARRKPS